MPAVDGPRHPPVTTEGAPCRTSSARSGPSASRSSRRLADHRRGLRHHSAASCSRHAGRRRGGGGLRRRCGVWSPSGSCPILFGAFMLIVSYGLLRGNSASRIAATVVSRLARLVDLDRHRRAVDPRHRDRERPRRPRDPDAALVGQGHALLQGPRARRAHELTQRPDEPATGSRATPGGSISARRVPIAPFVPLDSKTKRHSVYDEPHAGSTLPAMSMKECCG